MDNQVRYWKRLHNEGTMSTELFEAAKRIYEIEDYDALKYLYKLCSRKLHNHEQNTEQKREWHITGRLPYGENDGGFYEANSLKGAIQEFIKDLRGCYDDETWQKHIDESLSDTEEGMVIIETAMEQGGEMHISCEQPITNEAKAI